MKKQELIEWILAYYEDYLSTLTVKELEVILASIENNNISI